MDHIIFKVLVRISKDDVVGNIPEVVNPFDTRWREKLASKENKI